MPLRPVLRLLVFVAVPTAHSEERLLFGLQEFDRGSVVCGCTLYESNMASSEGGRKSTVRSFGHGRQWNSTRGNHQYRDQRQDPPNL